MAGALLSRGVPQSAQNSRVTGLSRSPRWNGFGEPLV